MMSNRTIVEINHDYPIGDDARSILMWALRVRMYLGNAEPGLLPDGVRFLHYRHHSEPLPLEPQNRREQGRTPRMNDWFGKWADQLIAEAKATQP